MKIDYDEEEDILFIRFNDEPVEQDISYGWNVNVGMTAGGIGQITILDAKADGLLPVKVPEAVLHQAIVLG
ncbi:MAG: DUF2283 domain-containing protein [Magnetococcales bacterium]|nr:DUF2283 domain-containing protein [Magnetococcales bacterium]MBF0116942.1 DUF2283 domain-containing protein [Magnetococcales bacterium]